jgi:hypothetical protein
MSVKRIYCLMGECTCLAGFDRLGGKLGLGPPHMPGAKYTYTPVQLTLADPHDNVFS